jgi:hypothetical protein
MAKLHAVSIAVDCLVPGCGQVLLDVPILDELVRNDKGEVEIRLEPDIKAALAQYRAHLAEVHPDVPVDDDAFPDDVGSD